MTVNYIIVPNTSTARLKEKFSKAGKSRGRGYVGTKKEGLQNQEEEGKER